MGSTQTPNYPDILGAITGGSRFNIDCIQCALSSRPDSIPAGQAFEAVMIIQNTVDSDVDVRVEVEIPQRDANKKKGVFYNKSSRLLVGLQPAEVGYVTMPISSSPNAAVADGYVVTMKLQVKQLNKNAVKVRSPRGGGVFARATLSEQTQNEMQKLQGLTFSIDTGGKRNQLQDTFEILPRGIASLRELKPGWVSLWTMRDYLDESLIVKRVQNELAEILPHLRREVVFKPLLQAVQEHFKQCLYPLHITEAIVITKLLTLVVEQTAEQAPVSAPSEIHSWYTQMARLLFQEKRFAQQPVYLVSKHLFTSILHDAILHGFTMVKTVLGEDFGDKDEIEAYAESVVSALISQEPLNFARTYLPLMAGGVIVNNRVTMPREPVQETLHSLSKAMKQREAERTKDNQFIFGMVENLIERGIEHF